MCSMWGAGEMEALARTQLLPKGNEFHLIVEASQQTYKLILPSCNAGAGEIEISETTPRVGWIADSFPAVFCRMGTKA